jgi:transcriptional regulator with XRE-family HTH domain
MADAGKKQADLVRETGLDKGSISSYLSGKYLPKDKAIAALARCLNVSEMWLWGYDVPKVRTEEQKKNDTLVDVVSKLRKDPEFFSVVADLAELSADEYASVKAIISALRNK